MYKLYVLIGIRHSDQCIRTDVLEFITREEAEVAYTNILLDSQKEFTIRVIKLYK